jgi:hypothetical protein
MAGIADALKQWQPPTAEEEALQAPAFEGEGGPMGALLDPAELLSNWNPSGMLSPAIAGWMTRTQAAKMLGPEAVKYLKSIPSAAFERMMPKNLKILPQEVVSKLAAKLGARQSAFTEGMMLTPEQYTPEILSQFRLPFAKQLRRGEPVMILSKETKRPTAQIAAHEATHEARARLKYPYNEKTRGIEEMAADAGEILSEFTPAEREALQDISRDPTGGVLQSFAELLEKTKVPLPEHVVPGAAHPLALETKTTSVRKSMQKHLKYGPVKKPTTPRTIEDTAASLHSGKPQLADPDQKIFDRLVKQIEAEKNPAYKKNLTNQLERIHSGKGSTLIGYAPEQPVDITAGKVEDVGKKGILGGLYGEAPNEETAKAIIDALADLEKRFPKE